MSLHPNHLDDLRKSGLTDATIEAAGIYSEADHRKIKSLLNQTKLPARMGAALVFPFKKVDGGNGYHRLKPDCPRTFQGKPNKYESPKGHPNEIYIPPGTFAALDKPEVDLLITEGEKKALRADQDGFRTIGLVGVYGWKEGKAARLLPALSRIVWKGRKVKIAYDSDIADKPEVRDAESRLAHHLTLLGADVKCIRLPGTAAGKQGLDDFLVASGKDGLFALIAQAIEPSPVEAGDTKADATLLDPAAEIANHLEADKRDGVYTLRFWRGSYLRYSRGRYREIEPDELRAHIVNRLNDRFVRLRRPDAGNCIMQIEAKTLLSADTETPAWLDDDHPDDWKPEEILSCRNGLIHLPSLAAGREFYRASTPRFFTTASVDFDFNAQADKPALWFDFLDRIWPDDPTSIGTLQEWFGYSLLSDTTQHKILMLIGPRRSGKGTVARILTALVGPGNVCNPKLHSLGMNFGLAPLIGKSLAIVGDARLSGRADAVAIAESLLSISGEDGQTIDRKNKSAWNGKVSTRFVLLSNELPRLSDASGALSGRMIVLRFTKSWYGQEDKTLTAKLLPELPGILLWAIGGWQRLAERGRFIEPDSSRGLRDEMDDLTSPVGAFVRQRCTIDPDAEVARREIYEAYKAAREADGVKHVEDEAGFGRNLRAAIPELSDTHHRVSGKMVRFYRGVRLKSASEDGFD